MEIATNIEKARPKRQPKPSKKVLENVKEQKNVRGKKNDSPKPTRMILQNQQDILLE